MESENRRIFYGWWIVLVTFVANFMSNGMSFYGWNTFLQPLCEAHSWSRTAVNVAPSLGSVIGIFSQPLFGRWVLKYGPKKLMIICAFASGGSFMLMGRADSLVYFYIANCMLFFSNVGINGLVPNTAVSNWFEKYRGKALGFSTSGISLSGAIIPPFAFLLLEHFSLAQSFAIIGALTWVVVIAATLLLMKDRPEDYGLHPDGISRDPAPSSEKIPDEILISRKELLRTQAFWHIGLAYGLMLPGVVGVMSQLKPRFTDIGFTGWDAVWMMAATALIGSFGKIAWGWLCDHFDPRRVVAAAILCQIAGLVVLAFGNSVLVLSLFIVLFGFGMGGVMSTIAIVSADFFGRANFAKVYGYIALFLGFQFSGYLMMGRSFDVSGSYNYAYLVFIGFYALALGLILTARYPRADLRG